jgi:hypothetical protein
MKQLLLTVVALAALMSCTKQASYPKVAHVYGTTYYLFPGAVISVGAIVDVPLQGDSATVEYKGIQYRVPVIFQIESRDNNAKVIEAKDVNGWELKY